VGTGVAPEAMATIEGATVLVTGATDGLGREVARDLAGRGAQVLVHGRRAERAQAVADEIGAAAVHLADFASLAQARTLAEELPPVDVLVNNAGLISRERVVTEDGCELTFQVNHLAHFLLTLRLLERDGPPRRVVNVASAGQEPPDFDDLMLERGYEPWRAYRQSKLAQIMFAFELAERRPDVESTALHPATFMDTKMVRATVGRPYSTVEEGVEATVRLIADLDLDVSGRYFDGLREAAPDPLAYDAGARRRLWEASERLTG
jgi:NAD(P)-dependent dehydrogenase (short-subunit alcohol dehydrogenase family)